MFHLSKRLHKYVGLLLILYGMLMGVSGIFVNHPEWIASLSVPRWLVPPQYHPHNLDRGTLNQLIYAANNPQQAYFSGTEGVWQTSDGGYTFQPMANGFPSARFQRVTNSLLLWEGKGDRLFAGTESGLFVCDPAVGLWDEVSLGKKAESVRSILAVDGNIVVCTDSDLWNCVAPPAGDEPWTFQKIDSQRSIADDSPARRVSVILVFFELHSGAFFGQYGKLLFDLVGVITVLLCCSGFYLWYYPWRKKYRHKRRVENETLAFLRSSTNEHTSQGQECKRSKANAAFRFLFKYHLKIGIWVTPILLLMAGTGFFMRPPLLLVPARFSVPASWYPGHSTVESWEGRITRAVHDQLNHQIIIESSDGFWVAPDGDLTQPFVAFDWPLPIHIMGSTVLDTDHQTGYLIAGSFSGGFRFDPVHHEVIDIMTGHGARDVPTMRSAEHMVTGHFTTPAGEEFVTTFHGGLIPIGNAKREGRFEMPSAMIDDYQMPLWNYMFEIHNGRFFRDWIGSWYLLVPILGSMLFFILAITGLFDWLMIRVIAPRRRSCTNHI